MFIPFALAAGTALLLHGVEHMKTCDDVSILSTSTCSQEGQLLQRITARAKTMLNHPSIQSTEQVKRIKARWSGVLAELHQTDVPAVSTGKEHIRVCLKSGDENAIFFIVIHELAHVATMSFGHTDEFWANMGLLISGARAAGVYGNHNETAEVCGTQVGPEPPVYTGTSS